MPHGWSVIVTSPAAFRFTYKAMPERHREVAELLAGEKIENADENTLPEIIIQLMKDVGAPNRVRELGYGEDDIDDLVDGAMKQERLLVGAPRRCQKRTWRTSCASRWRIGDRAFQQSASQLVSG